MRRNYCQIVRRKPVTQFLFCFLLAVSISATAQEQFVEPPAKLLTTFRFRQLSGGVILLKARFANYADTLNFILDTGSGGISLDSTTVDYFRITPTPSDMTILGIAGVRKVSFLYNQKLHLPGLTVDSLNFHINNYEILYSDYGMKIDGIIWYSFFRRFLVFIDYEAGGTNPQATIRIWINPSNEDRMGHDTDYINS